MRATFARAVEWNYTCASLQSSLSLNLVCRASYELILLIQNTDAEALDLNRIISRVASAFNHTERVAICY